MQSVTMARRRVRERLCLSISEYDVGWCASLSYLGDTLHELDRDLACIADAAEVETLAVEIDLGVYGQGRQRSSAIPAEPQSKPMNGCICGRHSIHEREPGGLSRRVEAAYDFESTSD